VVQIKRIRKDDIPAAAEFGKEFYKETPWPAHGVHYDVKHMEKLLHTLDDIGIMQMAVEEDGTIVGVLVAIIGPFVFNPAFTVGTEIALYVTPKYRQTKLGLQLIKQAEFIAKQKGVKYFNLVSLVGKTLKDPHSLYERLGYAKTETAYMKEIN
jgi:GNAT superfamily N-acetyltransferase